MKKYLILLLIIPFFLNAQNIVEKNIKTHITFLASDKLKGRATGSEGEQESAIYISNLFSQYGLKPYGFLCGKDGSSNNANTFYFPFTFKYNPDPHDTTGKSAEERTGADVVGFLDNGAENTIVIGAHYDHLGLGMDHNSLDAKSGRKNS